MFFVEVTFDIGGGKQDWGEGGERSQIHHIEAIQMTVVKQLLNNYRIFRFYKRTQ